MNIDEYLIELIKKTDIKESDIFYFEDSPYKSDFTETLTFYKETLEIAHKYGIEKSFLFFENDKRPNAKAKTDQGIGIIAFTSGLMIEYLTQYKNNEKINDTLQEYFNLITPYLDNSISVLIYQYLLHATFYHELGHLVQTIKTKSSDWQNEHIDNDDSFSLLRQALELNADTFSAINCASHIQQYAFKIFKDEITIEKMSLLIELFLTGYYLYFLSIPSAKKALYFEEYHHPHPIVRILSVVLTCINYLSKSPKLIELKIKLNPLKILNNVVYLGTLIEKDVLKKADNVDFLKELKNNRAEIIRYFYKLQEQSLEEYSSAIEIWNKMVSK